MIQQIGAIGGTAVSTGGAAASIGEDVFLNLLVTQLKNQDPLEPMEGTQFVTQLAQFSELDEMRNMAGAQKELQHYLSSLNNFASVSLLGRDVEFGGDTVTCQAGTATSIRFRLPADAAQVTVTLYDGQGRAVRTLEQGPFGAGEQVLTWDGIDQNGVPVPSGTYRCEVTAKGASGDALQAELVQHGRVEEVAFQGGVPYVRVGDRWIALSEIEGIRDPS